MQRNDSQWQLSFDIGSWSIHQTSMNSTWLFVPIAVRIADCQRMPLTCSSVWRVFEDLKDFFCSFLQPVVIHIWEKDWQRKFIIYHSVHVKLRFKLKKTQFWRNKASCWFFLQKCIYNHETKQASKFQSAPISNCFTMYVCKIKCWKSTLLYFLLSYCVLYCISFYTSYVVFWHMWYLGLLA